ncbi:40S ribosomal protein mrp2, mitochondrial [Sporothrix stenoceras]|uniref:40S ribosomal protein mrp2, mitochondrial n=1 Tax=Sporothrix stenoceras TaxID=5173 RepID=A0ABR3ZS11_9PEZI
MVRPPSFAPKRLNIGSFVNVHVIRDDTKRQFFLRYEAERQALRHIIRNTTLSPRTRAEAQLQLTQMPTYSRPTQIRNRCLIGGEGRGVLRDFKMSRFNFRIQALAGNLPGVRKASW